MQQRPIAGPEGLFTVNRSPRFIADSGAVGWAGAFFTELWAAPEGTADHAHTRLCLQQWLAPFRVREQRPGAAWESMAPGMRVWLPGDEQRAAWRGGGCSRFLFVEAARVEQTLDEPDVWRRLRPRQAGTCASTVAQALLQALAADLQEGSPAGPLVGDALITGLLAHLWARDDGPRTAPGLAPLAQRRVLAYIEEHLARPLSLAELAQQARMSVRHFSRAFRASVGCPAHQYLLSRRVELAKRLLADGPLALADVAQALGFADQSQFTRTFKRHAGITPAAFRASL